MIYAGFWKRVAAYIIDAVVLAVGGYVIGLIVGGLLAAGGGSRLDALESLGNLLGAVVVWLYHALLESSTAQATVGKMVLGIIVTDLEGARLSFGRASVRFFGRILSALILGIGLLMVGFTRRKQGLHDMIAGCLVVNR